jgi:hypothetical protein
MSENSNLDILRIQIGSTQQKKLNKTQTHLQDIT